MKKVAINEHELAERWGVSPKTLQRWRSEGRGPRYLKLSKRVTYLMEDILAYEIESMHTRERFGDWEADLVIGAGQQQALVTLNERQSRYALIAHVPFKTAQAVSDAMISLLTPFAACVHTLTTDNGKEFAQHQRIASELGADFYFAHPYASWERGANENMNGLIRQFFPKKMSFREITTKDIEFAMQRLNHRPRKCLGFKTPHEVFMKQLHSPHTYVALLT